MREMDNDKAELEVKILNSENTKNLKVKIAI